MWPTPAAHVEVKDPYYTWYNEESVCRRILAEFGAAGLLPYHQRAMCRSRRKTARAPSRGADGSSSSTAGSAGPTNDKTGIAGYTLTYSSRDMSLRTHQPFISAEKAITENIDIVSRENILEQENRRVLVEDVDEGEVLREKVHDLKQLVAAYQLGWIKETAIEDRGVVSRSGPGRCCTFCEKGRKKAE